MLFMKSPDSEPRILPRLMRDETLRRLTVLARDAERLAQEVEREIRGVRKDEFGYNGRARRETR